MGGTRDSYVDEEVTLGHNLSPSWSDLPSDILLRILQLLGLPEAVAFASVCTTWCSVATAAGVPRSCVPMVMSWQDIVQSRTGQEIKCNSDVTCKFRHILDAHKAYNVSFPQGLCFVACCGSSHGWLFLVNELANLVLYNPFTSSMIHLPPITDFTCIEAIDGGKAYHFEKFRVHDAKYLATWFYQKAVLSCSPSKGADYAVMIIHRDNNWLSFVRAGENKWQVASTLPANEDDHYADCVYHNGRFYTVTFKGIVEKWELDGPNGPAKEVIVAIRHCARKNLTRNLVSTPWGDMLEVCAFPAKCRSMYQDGVRFQVLMVDRDGCKKTSPLSVMNLREHAIFLGLNQSACLSIKNFHWLRGCCIYFSAPWMTHTCNLLRRCPGWGGVRTYDMEKNTFEHAFPLFIPKDYTNPTPSEVWITPN